MMSGDLSLAFSPLVPWPLVAALGAIGAGVVALALARGAKGAWWRLTALAGLLLALTNPTAVFEQRRPLADVALIVVDDSKSQSIGERRQRTQAALQHLGQRLQHEKDLEVREVHAGGSGDGTQLFEAIERALADVPRSRIAGITLLTDGQVHDVPGESARRGLPGPIHALITGNRGEADRRLIVEQSPRYAIVGKPHSMTIRVDDGPGTSTQGAPRALARVEIRRDGGEPQTMRVPVGEPQTIEFTLEHGGQTVFEIQVDAGPKELTFDNNRAVVLVNGVRDRLRVLLVTGEPHAGERTWRALLKSDPAVDLVHFTILRPPEAQDFTPVNELSLIAFPVRELFEVKLKEFDLIIFDRYRRRDVLASIYLDNITRYVREGGALLVAAGPNYGSPGNLFNSPLGQVLPAAPAGGVVEQGFKPHLTDIGRRHPVSADLPGADAADPPWGRWFRVVGSEARRGAVLMDGPNNLPLLLLDRVGDGRVAQIMSDHIWLWARGFEHGGPHQELLRRIAHWLMKEPELEEEDLRASVRGNRIEIVRRTLAAEPEPVTVVAPGGASQNVKLVPSRGGRWTASIEATESGLYHASDGTRVALAAVGALNPIEMADVRATEDRLKPVVVASAGQILWLADGLPDVRRVGPTGEGGGRAPSGRGWIGYRANGDFVVTGVTQVPLLPAIALFLLALGALVLAWRREGR